MLDIGDNHLMNNITIDEVLDLARDDLWSDVYDATTANYQIAQKWGVTLFAYEVWCFHVSLSSL